MCVPYDCRNEVATLKRSPVAGILGRLRDRSNKAARDCRKPPSTGADCAPTVGARRWTSGTAGLDRCFLLFFQFGDLTEYRLSAFEGHGQFYESVIVPTRHKNTNDLCD
jgi:hypothetical protein